MNYREALQYIHSVSWKGSMPGLSRIRALCDAMGNPERGLSFIHVGGTNGKGSVTAFLSTVLHEAGYRVGSFTSPYVRTFNERIAIDGIPVSNYLLARATERVRRFADALEEKPTEFELLTAIAFEVFRRKRCDIVVLEVGLGGRLDSTNIIESPLCSVITGIALDHTELLGDTLADIALEKAGIIKAGRPVCTAALAPEAAAVIERVAAEKCAPLFKVDPAAVKVAEHDLCGITFDYGERRGLHTSLCGLYQPRNAALACEVVDTLRGMGIEIGEDALRRGIEKTRWQARFELLSSAPVVIFDGGHNEEGVRAAMDTVKSNFGGKVNILTGVMRDKNYETMADIICECAARVFTVTPDNPRALPADEYAEVFKTRGIEATSFASVSDAVRSATSAAKADGIPLIILGSLYMYKDVRKHF